MRDLLTRFETRLAEAPPSICAFLPFMAGLTIVNALVPDDRALGAYALLVVAAVATLAVVGLRLARGASPARKVALVVAVAVLLPAVEVAVVVAVRDTWPAAMAAGLIPLAGVGAIAGAGAAVERSRTTAPGRG